MMESFHPFYKQAWDVTQRLEACPYYQKNAEESFLCHGEYNYHNLIFHGARVFTSGFERVTPGDAADRSGIFCPESYGKK